MCQRITTELRLRHPPTEVTRLLPPGKDCGVITMAGKGTKPTPFLQCTTLCISVGARAKPGPYSLQTLTMLMPAWQGRES